ncbi:uncharacterized protein LOC110733363 [Chenopodium quinoa]|uniref:uncharacterized protein LOC110733363 n=1 Tax=Chenopodium quinoa TaxID=63459 RepID=UPI000B77E072|nr:uncharacterized protein LOC110733363 [Chenopodium quinoa]
MGETMETENAAFWLPTHFLTDDDFLADQKPHRTLLKKDDLFSNSFGFDPNSSLDSPISSTETERGDSNNDEKLNINEDDDDFLAELTRHLAQSTLQDSHNSNTEKPWLFSTSPQSTLTGFGPWSNRSGFSSNGSPNGPSPRVPSPPATPPPKNDAAWELLYEAAGQVARLKMNAIAAQVNHHNNNQQNRGLLVAPRNVSLSKTHHHRQQLNSFYDFPHSTPEFQYEQVKRQGNTGNFYCQQHHHHQQRRSCGGGPLGLPQSAWPSLRPNHHRQPNGGGPGMRAVFLNGPGSGPPGMKRQSTGTGVFLPRGAGTTTRQAPPPEPRKKPTVILSARGVHALNRDFEEVNPNAHSRFGSGLLSDHDIIMARRNAILEQRRSMIRNDEIRLPSDWTY